VTSLCVVQVAQAVAHGLGVPIEMIKVRPNLTYCVPNASLTGGSTTSERAVNVSQQCFTHGRGLVVVCQCVSVTFIVLQLNEAPRTVCGKALYKFS
jgi:hypothetical protein